MWRTGDEIVYRHRSLDGRYLAGFPLRVIDANDERVVAYLPHGTVISQPIAEDGRTLRELPLTERWAHRRIGLRRPFTLLDDAGRPGHLVMVFPRGRAHSIWVFREPGRVLGWYVNLEEPHIFAARTISTRDHVLDVWVPGETGEAEWKDEDELAMAVHVGRLTSDESAGIRAEGERVMRERPWPTGWEDWTPDPSWTTPELSDGWDVG